MKPRDDRPPVQLWIVMVEDSERRVLDRVMLYAAERPTDAAAMARRFYVADGKSPRRYHFTPQRIAEVYAPDGTAYRVVLDPVPTPGP